MEASRQIGRKGRFVLFAAVLLGALITSGIAFGYVSTDQPDYSPGSEVTVGGGNDGSGVPGYVPGNAVHVDVSGPGGSALACDAIAQADATWSCRVVLSGDPTVAVGAYDYTATSTDIVGNPIHESGSFTDAIATTTSVSSNNNPSTLGQSVTFTATVKRNDTNAAVTVGQVKFGTGNNCTGGFTQLQAAQNVDSNGHATYATSILAQGTTTVRACYLGFGSGSSAFQTSDGTVTQTVNAGDVTPPTVTIVSALPSILGSGGSSTVTWHANENGTYSVRIGGTDCSTGTQVASGGYSTQPNNITATVTASDLSEGANTVRICVSDAASNTGSATTSLTLDSTAPTSQVSSTTPTGLSSDDWASQNVTLNLSASDGAGGSGVKSITYAASGAQTIAATTVNGSSTSVSVSTEGTTTVSFYATDNASNVEAPANTFVVKIDKTAPAVTCGSADGSWHAGDVSIGCTASDSLSGLASSGDASFSLSTSVADGTGTSAAATGSRIVYDAAGNSATAGPIGGNKVDRKAPTYSCDAPPAGWSSSDVTVQCTASDDGSGVTPSGDATFSLSTSVPSGTETDNASTGSKVLTDGVGNTVTAGPITGLKVDEKGPTYTCDAAPTEWSATDVVIHCTASDGGSGLSPQSDSSFSLSTSVAAGTETDSASTGSKELQDAAGNQVTVPAVGGLKVDKKAPQQVSCDSADSDWHPDNVTLHCTYSDGGSGPASQQVALTTDVALDSESANAAASAGDSQACDAVGNCAPSPADITGNKVDRKAPQLTGCDPPDDVWHADNVTLYCTYVDGGSGPDTQKVALTTDVAVGSEDLNAAASAGTGKACDNVDNCASSPGDISGNKIDRKAPAISDDGTDDAPTGNDGTRDWFNHDVTVKFSATDGGSGLAGGCAAPWTATTSGEGQGVTASSGSCQDKVGNTAAAIASSGYNVDKTKPTISGSVVPASPDGSNGWYKTAPTVTFTCGDATSGVASCVADDNAPQDSITLGESASAQSVGGTATDNAGNSATASQGGLKVDLSDPAVDAWNGSISNGDSFYFGFVPPAPSCTGSDAISGIDSCAVSGWSNAVGSHTLTATAKDKAGRTKTETRSYTVLAWTLKGFYQPVDMGGVYNTVKNGSTVPLKFELFAGQTELTDVADVKSLTYAQTTCDATATTDDIETTATGGTVLRYDSTAGQFVYNWQTPRTAGKCYRVTMATQDGSSLMAFFKLK